MVKGLWMLSDYFRQGHLGRWSVSDRHINFAQAILHLLLYKDWETQSRKPLKAIEQGLQILHDRGNHWLVASNIGCLENLFSYPSDGTRKVINNLFEATESITINMVNMQKK